MSCSKCGYKKNPPEAKYCLNCGAKLSASSIVQPLDGLFYLHLVGSSYLLTSLVFNSVVRASIFLAIPYLVGGILGLISANELRRASRRRFVKILSASSVALGLVGTLMLFLIGMELRGIVGPAWLIFLINAWKLWRDRSSI
jgi:hypothetical protein